MKKNMFSLDFKCIQLKLEFKEEKIAEINRVHRIRHIRHQHSTLLPMRLARVRCLGQYLLQHRLHQLKVILRFKIEEKIIFS